MKKVGNNFGRMYTCLRLVKSNKIQPKSFEWLDGSIEDYADEYYGISGSEKNEGRRYKSWKCKETGDFVSGALEWLDEHEDEQDVNPESV